MFRLRNKSIPSIVFAQNQGFMRILQIIAFLFLSHFAQGQSSLEEDLSFYGDVMIHALEDAHKERARQNFNSLFLDFVSQQGSIDTSLSFMKYVSFLELEPDELSLVTWQTCLSDGHCDYEGFLFIKDSEPIRLNRTEPLGKDVLYTTSDTEDWYGCWYYAFKKLSDSQYLLFGYDGSSIYDNQMLVDVLTLSPEGISFGDDIFEDKETPGTFTNRLLLSYSSDASVSLNYSEGLGMIIHDHLTPRMGLQAGQGATNLPDGTYEGYRETEGKWMYIQKVFDHVYDEAPRPKPTGGSGLFDKSSGSNK